MANYKVLVRSSVVKEIESLPRKLRVLVTRRIRALGTAPRPVGCEKLMTEDRFRVRLGEYRIVYSVNDAGRIVLVVKVGHRREVYRR